MNQAKAQEILILGVGNVLLTDEGVGVRVAHELIAGYDFLPNVKVVDGGVLGLSLAGIMMEAQRVIVVDAVRGGDEPGTIYRFPWDARPEHIQYKDSLHQIDLMETMALLPLLGDPPEVVVIGVEFGDIDNYGLELTPEVERAVKPLLEQVLLELERLGYPAQAAAQPREVTNVFGHTSQNN
ncbi:MAG: HyaD/HybD family hydrogenase maturation endopeptidase [Proteobacteria bacterium]|nr:HyaD/HybD family hydrogenase maturation endopeptidase [Pseudomonadota bacterium]MBU1452206.1 HyaD/HybD family hydrogenase maturation endopeptidase [Pseudomonadota bacterium]MBU2519299.1 HyaD/HybD family hydrogenase maturation endopeptidase [Pseudomonadota bacterium]